jgi:periplasmic divalent cation tolerance protein
MSNMIVVYIPCVNKSEAKKIGDQVMQKRLAPCYNIISNMDSAAFWPPKSGEIEKVVDGVVLLIKTIDNYYERIEREVKKLHSDANPCIFAIPVAHVSQEYLKWLESEIK